MACCAPAVGTEAEMVPRGGAEDGMATRLLAQSASYKNYTEMRAGKPHIVMSTKYMEPAFGASVLVKMGLAQLGCTVYNSNTDLKEKCHGDRELQDKTWLQYLSKNMEDAAESKGFCLQLQVGDERSVGDMQKAEALMSSWIPLPTVRLCIDPSTICTKGFVSQAGLRQAVFLAGEQWRCGEKKTIDIVGKRDVPAMYDCDVRAKSELHSFDKAILERHAQVQTRAYKENIMRKGCPHIVLQAKFSEPSFGASVRIKMALVKLGCTVYNENTDCLLRYQDSQKANQAWLLSMNENLMAAAESKGLCLQVQMGAERNVTYMQQAEAIVNSWIPLPTVGMWIDPMAGPSDFISEADLRQALFLAGEQWRGGLKRMVEIIDVQDVSQSPELFILSTRFAGTSFHVAAKTKQLLEETFGARCYNPNYDNFVMYAKDTATANSRWLKTWRDMLRCIQSRERRGFVFHLVDDDEGGRQPCR